MHVAVTFMCIVCAKQYPIFTGGDSIQTLSLQTSVWVSYLCV